MISKTELTMVDEFQGFADSATVTNPDPLIPVIISGVTADKPHTGVTVSFTTDTVNWAGEYTSVFLDKFFQWRESANTESVGTAASVTDVPTSVYAITRYKPDMNLTTIITYTVTSNIGVDVVTQTVKNSWDRGRAQLLSILPRGAA